MNTNKAMSTKHPCSPDRLSSIHKDLAHILIKGTLAISNGGHVLDDDQMIGMFSRSVQNLVASHHVIHNIRLCNFLGPELSRRGQIVSKQGCFQKEKMNK